MTLASTGRFSRRRTLPPTLGMIGLSLCASAALAGKATIEGTDGSTSTFEYRDEMLRINTDAEAKSWAVVRDGSLFTVSISDGETVVIDAGSMMKSMRGMSLPSGPVPSALDGKLISFEDTGIDETIAGIKGDVWEVVVEEDGKRETSTIVLSTDKRAVEFSEAMFGMMSFAAELSSKQAQDQGADFRKRMQDMDAGVLRFGEDMKITSITDETIPMERFELPAEPMNMDGFGSMLKNIQQRQQQQPSQQQQSSSQSSSQGAKVEPRGNVFSTMMGALGGKKEGGAETKSEEGGKNPFSKAFGKFLKKDEAKDDSED